MTIIRKLMPAQVSALGDDEVEVIISTGQRARDGHIFEPQGCDLANYLRNPIVLWQHDPEQPVGNAAEIAVDGDKIRARVKFAPVGISPRADEIRGLVKAGVVRGVSVGMEPIDAEPIDAAKPRGGLRVSAWELLEFSFCSVPVDTEALVTARSEKKPEWKVGASRDLAIDDSDAWDGPAAAKSIFEHAGGDEFDPAKARQGFLVYNAAEPKLRGSYKLPIAHVVDGELKVPKGAIRAAASRLPQADIPDDVKKRAQSVLDHYKEKAGIGEEDEKDSERALKAKLTRALALAPRIPVLRRGLYEVAGLAHLLQHMGYCHDASEFEAAIEGDNSPVPGMIGEALVAVGKALVAMTQEEVSELLEGKDLEIEEEDDIELVEVTVEERAFIAAAKTPRVRAWRRGIALARAGRTLSAANEKRLEQAADHHERAMKHHGAIGEQHQALKRNMDAITAAQEKVRSAHEKLGDALEAAQKNPAEAQDHVERALRHHKAMAPQLDAGDEAQGDMADHHADLGDAHAAMGRAMKRAARCMRAVLDGSSTAASGEDGDSREIQKSGGDAEDGGSRSLRSALRCRVAALALN